MSKYVCKFNFRICTDNLSGLTRKLKKNQTQIILLTDNAFCFQVFSGHGTKRAGGQGVFEQHSQTQGLDLRCARVEPGVGLNDPWVPSQLRIFHDPITKKHKPARKPNAPFFFDVSAFILSIKPGLILVSFFQRSIFI